MNLYEHHIVWLLDLYEHCIVCYRLVWTPCYMIVLDLYEHHIVWLLQTCVNTTLHDCYGPVWTSNYLIVTDLYEYILYNCYGLNVYVHVRFICWDPVIRWSVVRRWGTRVRCGSEGGGLLNGINALTAVPREFTSSLGPPAGEDMRRGWQSANCKGSHQNLTMPTPESWPSRLQNYRKL